MSELRLEYPHVRFERMDEGDSQFAIVLPAKRTHVGMVYRRAIVGITLSLFSGAYCTLEETRDIFQFMESLTKENSHA